MVVDHPYENRYLLRMILQSKRKGFGTSQAPYPTEVSIYFAVNDIYPERSGRSEPLPYTK